MVTTAELELPTDFLEGKSQEKLLPLYKQPHRLREEALHHVRQVSLSARNRDGFPDADPKKAEKEKLDRFLKTFRIDENSRVHWEGKNYDRKVFARLAELIKGFFDHQRYQDRLEEFPLEIEFILIQSNLFQHLLNDGIEVTQAHTGRNPFFHTMDVVKDVLKEGLNTEIAIAVLWAAIFHDIAKLFGAQGRNSRFLPSLLYVW